MSERSLAAALVALAFDDLTAAEPDRTQYRNPSAFAYHRREWRAAHDEAQRFLTAAGGLWARSRRAWCEMADVDPDRVREVALHVLDHPHDAAGPSNPPLPHRQ